MWPHASCVFAIVVCCGLVIFSRFHGLSRIGIWEQRDFPYDRPTVHGKLRTLSRSKRVKDPELDVKSAIKHSA